MAKFEPFPRSRFRELRNAWLRRHRARVAGLAVAVGVLLVLEYLLLVVIGEPSAFRWWLLGVVQAALVGTFLVVVQVAFVVHDRQALWQMRGAWGEESTRDQLKIAKRKRVIWDSVDGIRLQAGDVDHFVVTRRGGLVVIDSKWRSGASDLAEMARDAAKVQVRAEGIARSCVERQHGARHREKSNSLRVTPLVVVWGQAQDDVPEGGQIDGIEFVAGRRLLSWLGSLDGSPVSRDAATDLVRRLKEFRKHAQLASTAR